MRNDRPHLSVLLLAIALTACGGEGASSGPGACSSDDDCETALCYQARCLDPLADEDSDGLPNLAERALGCDPFLADTDGDGLSDGAEVHDREAPLDTDDDGTIDALENALLDADRDCLPASSDRDETTPERDPTVLRAFLCRHAGACAAPGAIVDVTCVEGSHGCDYGRVAGFEDVERRCDGIDNDCDGLTDEGATWRGLVLGDACQGDGACGLGVVECRADGGTTCSSNPDGSSSGATPEVCNHADDDCDGLTDEGLLFNGSPLGGACDGVGACGAGRVECRADGATTCSSNVDGSHSGATAEACNGADDDCDGQTDEGLVGSVIDRCPLGGVCAKAFADLAVACVGGHWECDLSGVAGYEPHEASCDGQDNDCDGLTDEDLLPAQGGAWCGAEGVCAATPPKVSCLAGQWQCRYEGVPAFEAVEVTCDGQDNDCDGVIDGGLPVDVAPAWSLVVDLPADIDPAGPEEAGVPIHVDALAVWVLQRGSLWSGLLESGQWQSSGHSPVLEADPPGWLGHAADGFYVAWPGDAVTPPKVSRLDGPDGDPTLPLSPPSVCTSGAHVFALNDVTGAWCVAAEASATTLWGAKPAGEPPSVVTLIDPTRGPHPRRPAPAGPALVYLVGSSDALAWSPLTPDEVATVPFGGDAGEVTAAWVDPRGPQFFLKSTASPTGWFFSQGGTLDVLAAEAPFDATAVGPNGAGFDAVRRRLIHVGARDGLGASLAGVYELAEECP